ncbi:MAG: discoidin domain-containing protein, partial [Umezawaea sp.]
MTHVMPPSTFKRWRGRIAVLSAVAVAGSAVTVTAIFAATAPPEPDLLSQGKAVTASSIEGGHFAADRAVDGDTGSRWSSAFQDPQWIQVDLGSDAEISKVVLNWERAFAKDFTVQTSGDATTWTTISTVADGDGGVETLDVTGSGR